MFPVVLSVILGLFWTRLVGFLRSSSASPTTLTRPEVLSTVEFKEFKALTGRPNFETIFAAAGDNQAIVVAGPKSMVDSVEKSSIGKKYSLFNESWKV